MTQLAGETGSRPRYRAAVVGLERHQKTAKGAPAYSRFVNRRLGRHLAALAHVRGATPDQLTAISAGCSLLGIAVLAVLPVTVASAVLITASLVLGYAFDSADGQLARLTGTGSPAGEWLDHVVDAVKIVLLHAAVLLSLARTDLRRGWLLVPLCYLCVASSWFFAMILTDQLRRQRRGPVAPRSTAGPALLRSLLALPADYGVTCLLFLLLPWTQVFLGAYLAMLLGTSAIFAASLRSWYRELAPVPGGTR